jgi:site-specific DNA-methyltransferase (adenine-specific)
MKPYYEDGLTTIYNKDCLEVMDYLIEQGIKADLLLIDPDYPITKGGYVGTGGLYNSKSSQKGNVFGKESLDIKEWLPKTIKLLNDDAHIYIMCNDINLINYHNVILENGLEIYKNLIWVKGNKITNQYYMSQKEYIIFARKGKAKKINDCGTSDVLMFSVTKEKNHLGDNYNDTEKPLELGELLVTNSTNENDLVLDIMCGSGTFNVASKRTNRRSIGIDIRESQCARTKWRLQNIQGKLF